jgi:hypothetical protein
MMGRSENGMSQLPTRRRYVAALAGVAALGAGCSSLTSQSFESNPVVLPADAQESLRLAETLGRLEAQ